MQFRLAVCMCAVVLLAACSGNKKEEAQENSQDIKKEFLKNVKTAKAVLSNEEQELILTGKVEYDPDKVIKYLPMVSGIVERTYFSLGDKVQKGQALLDLRSSDLSSLQSEFASLEADIKTAQRELKTAQSMYDDKMLSEAELLAAQAKLNQAQAAFSKIHSDMSVYGTNKGNGIFAVRSPMAGYIVEKNTTSGSPVSTDGDPLFTVADLSTVWIIVNIYASNLPFVKEGMDVEISTLSYPGEIFKGKINVLSQVFDPEEKVLKARIVMPNKDLKLKPEMSATIKIKDETTKQFVAIPSQSLIFDNDRYHVVVEQSPDHFVNREVAIFSHNNETTYIASGLSEGESVVTKNQLLIYSRLKEN